MRRFALAAIGIVALASIGGAVGGADAATAAPVLLLVGLPALAWICLAGLPGRVARARAHKDAEAIRICGLVGFLLPVVWIVAIVWAHTESTGPDVVR